MITARLPENGKGAINSNLFFCMISHEGNNAQISHLIIPGGLIVCKGGTVMCTGVP